MVWWGAVGTHRPGAGLAVQIGGWRLGWGAGPRPIWPFPAIPQRGWSRARLGPEPPLRALLHPAQGLALNKYVLTKTVIA